MGRDIGGTWRQSRARKWAVAVAERGPKPQPARPPAATARRQFTPPVVEYVNLNPQLPMEPTLVMSEIALPNIDLPRFGDPTEFPGRLREAADRVAALATALAPAWATARASATVRARAEAESLEAGADLSATFTQPVLLWKIEPRVHRRGARAKIQGTVVLHIEVDTRGQAQNITVRQSLGLGLDERAIEAVRRWRFRPGYRNGKPWVASALVQVNFRLL